MANAICIACGCSDNDACMVPARDGGRARHPCGWVVVDRKGGVGICSAPQCRTELHRWDGGDRQLSAKAKERAEVRARG